MKRGFRGQVALVVGASSGFGRLTAIGLLKRGFTVFAVARRVEKMRQLKKIGIHTMYMDVTDEASVETCVNEIIGITGRIDVLVNNAGYGAYGMIECVPLEDVHRQFDVNVFGMARVNNAVLPYMRKQGSGRIIMTASMASHISTIHSGWYSATKHAIKGMSEALRMELSQSGVSVIVIEPGPVKTGFEEATKPSYGKAKIIEDYAALAKQAERYMSKAYASSPGPRSTVRDIIKAATVKSPRLVYKTTFAAKVLPKFKGLIGLRLYTQLVVKIFKSV